MIKLHLQVGKTYIDNNCKEVKDPYIIRCDYSDRKNFMKQQNNQYIIEKNGIQFYFDIISEDADSNSSKIQLSCIKLNLKMGESKQNLEKIPPHIFGELVKTTKGIELLKNKNEATYLDWFIEDIKDPKIKIIQKRASLWAIGHIGSTKRGIQLLIERNVIKELVSMAQVSEYLSLRGTCLYILNMICKTSEGRQQLEKLDWNSHFNCNLGWICTPKNIEQFF